MNKLLRTSSTSTREGKGVCPSLSAFKKTFVAVTNELYRLLDEGLDDARKGEKRPFKDVVAQAKRGLRDEL